MTARSFEDIIQVSTLPYQQPKRGAEFIHSVGYPLSRDCFPSHTTRSFSTFSLTSQHGTHMPSSGNTPSTPSSRSGHKRKSSAISSVASLTRPAPSSRQPVSRARRLLVFAVVQERQKNKARRQVPRDHQRGATQTSNSSMWQPTRSTHSVTMQTRLSVLGPPIASHPNTFVGHPSTIVSKLRHCFVGRT